MKRREFMKLGVAAAVATGTYAWGAKPRKIAPPSHPLDAAAYRASRRYANLPSGKIAYIERGSGKAALFLHGAPLNSFQWRGAIDRLSTQRRCIAPDFMGLGYSEVPEGQSLAAAAEVEMLAALLDSLGIHSVDIIASDSGGAVAQLFVVRYPKRVRTMLLTNCDVEPDSPPAKVKPVLELARTHKLADATAAWLTDQPLARSTFGAAVFRDPAHLTSEVLEYYVTPLVSSPLRRTQYEAFHLALEPNPLAGIEASLRQSNVPVRIVWGTSDDIFLEADAKYLDRTFPKSQGIRRVPEGKLFFQEEYPEIVAEEAQLLWRNG